MLHGIGNIWNSFQPLNLCFFISFVSWLSRDLHLGTFIMPQTLASFPIDFMGLGEGGARRFLCGGYSHVIENLLSVYKPGQWSLITLCVPQCVCHVLDGYYTCV